ncbi:MAG: DUF3192 domain-containing protein [Candidatus Omnitrophota bacterium]
MIYNNVKRYDICAIFLAIVCIIISGCAAATLPYIRYENSERLKKLSLGMTKQQVLDIMGTKPIKAHNSFGEEMGIIDNPYKTQGFEVEGKNYEVIYYYTQIVHSDGIINEDELTPLVFCEDKLTGAGWDFYRDITKQQGGN